MEIEIKVVKPQISKFEVREKEDAWKEVVYSARMSGVPAEIQGKNVFQMIVNNDYGSALEHIIVKFDLRMTKGNAPELLEHRMVSHSGYSTRFIKASKGIEKEKPIYEIIMPWHLLKLEENHLDKQVFLESARKGIGTYEKLLASGVPRESARYTLPFCQAVGIYHITINLRSLLNLLSLRLCVRTSPEFRCLASQIYFGLTKQLPIMKGLVGCRGFMRKVCPEAGVTGVREGAQHQVYPPCLFRNSASEIFIPTWKQLMNGVEKSNFDTDKAIEAQERNFRKWAEWQG